MNVGGQIGINSIKGFLLVKQLCLFYFKVIEVNSFANPLELFGRLFDIKVFHLKIRFLLFGVELKVVAFC